MPSASSQRPRTKRSSGKRRKKRRGPLMRFHISKVILIWLFCFIIAFLLYMVSRNLHPEKDVFLDHDITEESSVSSTVDLLPDDTADESSISEENHSAENSNTAEESSEEESSQAVIDAKVNPVPEGTAHAAEYLESCAFVGETDIYNMGQAGLLGAMNTYASETLTLTNYGSEYVMLDGTTIHIQSALYAANCPIYMMFGTEDLLAGQPADQTADQFSVLLNLIKAAAPESDIFVLSIPPVTAAAEASLANSVIDEYNSLLLQAANNVNVYFVDTNTALKNNESQLDANHALEDGIHLTTEAEQILLNYVLSHVPENS